MLRKESKVVPKGNNPVHQQDEFGFANPRWWIHFES